ncbi:MAG: hypothetical protein Q3971_04085 [Moraxella sp.]|nr:hypothetical protein [Moraxella sp.]
MHPEILEYDTYDKILYRNANEEAQRILVLDKNGNTIQDEIDEYIDGKRVATIIFGADHVTIIGKREYTDDGYKDYRKVGNGLVLVRSEKSQWLIPEQKVKSTVYDGRGEIVYYTIFEKHSDDIGMVPTGEFDKNDKPFTWAKPPKEVENLKIYNDY